VSREVAGATLAIHPGALGDVLLAIPALRALRAAGDRVTLAAQPRIASLLVALGEADDGCDFESLRLDALFAGESGARLPAVERVVCWFGARDPDFARRLAAISPGALVAASIDRGGLTPPSHTPGDRGGLTPPSHTPGDREELTPPSDTPGAPGRAVWRHLLATIGDARERRDVAYVSDTLVAEGRAALAGAGSDGARRVVVVHPGAGSAAKRWPAAAFAEALAALAARSDVEIVVHEGPADTEPAARLLRLVPSARGLREPALPALAGVLAKCAAYVGNDSGVSHLAAVVGAPAVVLFAAANLAWRPWARAVRVLTVALERAEAGDVSEVRGALDAALG